MIRNIWCVGRNYKKHAQELGNEVPTSPLIFLKAGSCVVSNGEPITIPEWTQNLHHEVEVGAFFNDRLEIDKIGVALDLTARDIQNQVKKQGLPWTQAKSFKGACALGSVKSISPALICDLKLKLIVNGKLRQEGSADQMIFDIKTLVDHLKKHFPVCPGDLLLTGTPEGVSQLRLGDKVHAEIPGYSTGEWTVSR